MRNVCKKRLLSLGCVTILLLGLWTLWFVGLFGPRTTVVGPALEPFCVGFHPDMAELSGLVQSRAYPDVLWTHNDSGNEPRLFAMTVDGEVVNPGLEVQEATLRDWESITRWGDNLYLTEMGNNLNASRRLGVYEIPEPNPHTATSVRPSRFLPVRYPDQQHFPPWDRWHFDCEASFALDGSLYFVTKNRPAFRLFVQQGSANLYKLDLGDLQEDNVLEAVDSIDDLGGWVTGADVSSDGRWIALLIESPLQSIWLFERPASGDRLLSEAKSVRRFVFHEGGQLEALAFVTQSGQEFLQMINEQQEMFKVEMDDFQEVR